MFLTILVTASLALEPKQAPHFDITCEQVREYVATYGRVRALAFAISHGATVEQIRNAAKCLR